MRLIRQLINSRRVGTLSGELSQRAVRLLAGAKWRSTTREREAIVREFQEKGMTPSPGLVRSQALVGGVEYAVKPYGATFAFDLFPVHVEGCGEERIALFTGYRHAQYVFGVTRDGAVVIAGDTLYTIASDVIHMIEQDALVSELARQWRSISWVDMRRDNKGDVGTISRVLLDSELGMAMDIPASDAHSAMMMSQDACILLGQSWNVAGSLILRVFSRREAHAREVCMRAEDLLIKGGIEEVHLL